MKLYRINMNSEYHEEKMKRVNKYIDLNQSEWMRM